MGCEPLTNCEQLRNKIALMKRGGCMFAEKVKNAEFCGAIGALIIDNQPNTRFGLFFKLIKFNDFAVAMAWASFQWPAMGKPW